MSFDCGRTQPLPQRNLIRRHPRKSDEYRSVDEVFPALRNFGHESLRSFDYGQRHRSICDDYRSIEEVSAALAQAGLESSNLIVGIDFTESNQWTGSRSFNRRSLHHIGDDPNPYEQAIAIIGKTLHSFEEDNMIPCFGFGDASTHDTEVFSFYPNDQCCNGFEEVLTRYREIVPNLNLAGPKSFGPVIEMATNKVEQSGGKYHVLLIIADGQVTRSVDTRPGYLSDQEQNTIDAIFKAEDYPLSIILVGVGDEPWERRREFDELLPAFDNFHFVNFTEIMSKNIHTFGRQAKFAKSALMGLPSQYRSFIKRGMLGRKQGASPNRVPLPPPNNSNSFQRITGHDSFRESEANTSTYSSSSYANQDCSICETEPKNLAFGCGHQTCYKCAKRIELCPFCRTPIKIRIRLY